MISVKGVSEKHYVCHHCTKKEKIYVLIVKPDRAARDTPPGWWQSTWLCRDCLALLAHRVTMAICDPETGDGT